MRPTVFIDGEAGTTGLQIRDRLQADPNIELLSVDPDKRKDAGTRQDAMRQADVIILCLPDEAAREAVALADELGDAAPRIIDASTAHRTAAGWVYGFPELVPGHSENISVAQKVANPGCYATGAIALLRPLIEAKFIPPDFPISINAVSGYTGGGKSMISSYEGNEGADFELYALGLRHKHLAEIITHAGLKSQPIFVPSVGNFAQGMFVSIPLHLNSLDNPPTLSDIDQLYPAYYADAAQTVSVITDFDSNWHREGQRLRIDPSANSDKLEIYLFGDDDKLRQLLLVARLDNLGKGAAGAAVQNLKLMLQMSDNPA